MTITFKSLLLDSGVDPKEVSMLRHRPAGPFDPFNVWRSNRAAFDDYQSVQMQSNRARFRRPIWAAFTSMRGGKTLFLGLYSSKFLGPLPPGTVELVSGQLLEHSIRDRYECAPLENLSEYGGRLFIDWGNSTRQWVQHGEANKPIVELYDVYQEPSFPGHLQLIAPLSALGDFPSTWVEILRNSRGIYLLTCPRTKEQYVGKADGEDGFWGRWSSYALTSHGGNVRLKSREPSDYQVSVLQIAGSADTSADILRMESLWKEKLQTREMGLNGN